MDRDPLLTEVEAGREMRVSRATVRQERIDGRIQFVKIRKRIFYRLSEIRAYLERSTCQNTNSPSDPIPQTGTSFGPKGDAASAIRRARQIATRQNSSLRRIA